MSQTDVELRSLVDSFVEQLKNLLRRSALETVQSALGEETPARRGRKPGIARAVAAAPATRARKKGAKRTPEELEALVGSLVDYVRKNPGQRIEQIGAGLGIGTKELALPAKKLIADKQLRTKGQKRATTYFAK
jgi:hypothetical protein